MKALGKTTLAVLLMVGFLLAAAEPSEAAIKKLGRCHWAGTLACHASGTVRHPMALSLSGRSVLHRRIPVGWTTRCWKRGELRRREGNFSRRAPFDRRIEMGYWRPNRCKVNVDIFTFDFGRHGRVTMLARVR